MKDRRLFILALVALTACHQVPKSDKTVAGVEQQKAALLGDSYIVDTAGSRIIWVGTKVNGSHTGTIKLSDGLIALNKGMVQGGRFTINLVTLQNDDLSAKEKEKIENHLKSSDFFDVANHPTGSFEITRVEPFDKAKDKSVLTDANHIIQGNLTLKGVTKNVAFPATVTVSGNSLKAKANFLINRTDWGMNYKGANNPQDWLIKKDVNLKLDISASKQ